MYIGIELPILDAFNPLLTHFYHCRYIITSCVWLLRVFLLYVNIFYPHGDAFYPQLTSIILTDSVLRSSFYTGQNRLATVPAGEALAFENEDHFKVKYTWY